MSSFRVLKLEKIISDLIKEEFGVFLYSNTNSTQDLAREMLDCQTQPYVVIAQEQTSGRGRQAREWNNVKQGIYFTLVLPALNHSSFSLVVALALHEIISKEKTIIIKWANDIIDCDNKKIAGILIEKVKDSFLIGVGINLSGDNENFGYIYKDNVSEDQYCNIIAKILLEIVNYHRIFKDLGFIYFKEKWLNSTFSIGRMIEYRQGTTKRKAKFNGITDSGALIVLDEMEEKTITTAEIEVL